MKVLPNFLCTLNLYSDGKKKNNPTTSNFLQTLMIRRKEKFSHVSRFVFHWPKRVSLQVVSERDCRTLLALSSEHLIPNLPLIHGAPLN